MDKEENDSKYPVFFQAHYGDFIGGASYREPMAEALESYGVQTMLDTRARQLVVNEEDGVVGVRATTEDGDISIKALRGVVLATGGYSSNSDLIGVFAEQYKGMCQGSGTLTRSTLGFRSPLASEAVPGAAPLPTAPRHSGSRLSTRSSSSSRLCVSVFA